MPCWNQQVCLGLISHLLCITCRQIYAIDHKHNRVEWLFDQYEAMKWLNETEDPDRSSKGECNLREKF